MLLEGLCVNTAELACIAVGGECVICTRCIITTTAKEKSITDKQG